MRHLFSMGDQSGLLAGRSSTHTVLLQSYAVVTGTQLVSHLLPDDEIDRI